MRSCPVGQISLRRTVRRTSLALGAFVCLAAPLAHAVQTVSPPIAEYQERARSSFQLINSTIFPLSVVLEVHGFTVTEQGEVQETPLDTTKVRVKLSAMSFRIPPRQTYTVFYEATADSEAEQRSQDRARQSRCQEGRPATCRGHDGASEGWAGCWLNQVSSAAW